MTDFDLKIKDLPFDDMTPLELEKSHFYDIWPVVYILNNAKEMYIGETYHSAERMKQHLKRPERRRLDEAHIIASESFTKSATLDIESSLIELCSALGTNGRSLQNANNGLVKHNYANKKYFAQDSDFFARLWQRLLEKGLVSGSIEDLKNTDLFKYSPYKSLNAEQCTTRDYIIEDILDAFVKDENRCIFVNGGAGTGKTILAIYLMKLLVTNADYLTEEDDSTMLPFIEDLKMINELRKDLKIGYVVAMTSFRNTLREVFKHVKGLKPSMVISPSETSQMHYDILIVDEAHRLRRRKAIVSYEAFDNTNKRLGLPYGNGEDDGNELDWIMKSSDVQILFYDQTQSIRASDITREQFERVQKNNPVHNLSSQMRCLGGNDYIRYVEDILNQKQDGFIDFSNTEYDFRLFDDLNDMCDVILQREKEIGLARIVAGYGFEWVSKIDGSPDIVLDGRKLYWNRVSQRWPTSISGDKVVEEAGCIHTIQGYDLNYCGVIFGPEIQYRNGKIIVDKKHYDDKTGKMGIKTYEELVTYIINIYKVLMTRGIRGTYVYVCDRGLREYMRSYIKSFEKEDPAKHENIQ